MINNIDDYIYSLLLEEFNTIPTSELTYIDRYWSAGETVLAIPKAHSYIVSKNESKDPQIKGVSVGTAIIEIETVQNAMITNLRTKLSETSEIIRKAINNISLKKNLYIKIDDVYTIKINGIEINNIFYSINTSGQVYGATLTNFEINYSLHY